MFPLKGQYVLVPYLKLSSRRDAATHSTMRKLSPFCSELLDLTVARTNGDCVGRALFYLLADIKYKRISIYIQSLVHLVSERPSGDGALFSSTGIQDFFFPSRGFSFFPFLPVERASRYSEGSKVDNGQQFNFTAPGSDRHRVILPGTPPNAALCISSRTL